MTRKRRSGFATSERRVRETPNPTEKEMLRHFGAPSRAEVEDEVRTRPKKEFRMTRKRRSGFAASERPAERRVRGTRTRPKKRCFATSELRQSGGGGQSPRPTEKKRSK